MVCKPDLFSEAVTWDQIPSLEGCRADTKTLGFADPLPARRGGQETVGKEPIGNKSFCNWQLVPVTRGVIADHSYGLCKMLN